MGQDINWDLLGYHFYNGFAFVHHRLNQDITSALMQTYLNPFFDVLTYYLIELHHPTVTIFILGAVSGLNAFLLFHIAKKVFSPESQFKHPVYSLLAVLIGVTGAGGLSLLGTTTNDTYSTVLVLGSLYCYLLSLDEKPARFYLSVSGLLIGAVFGLKLTNFSYLVGLNITLLFFKANRADFLIYWACCFLGFFIVDAAWMYQIYMEFGNPIFPYYNNIFHSPYISTGTFNLEPGLVQASWQTLLFLPFHLAAKANLYTTESLLRDGRFAIVALLLLATVLFRRGVSGNRYLKVLSCFFIASYVAWCLEFHVYRYTLPLEMLSGILIIALLKPLFQTHRLFILALALLMLFAFISTVPPQWKRHSLSADYFSLQAPAVPDDAVIVLLSRPYTYVIPFFNPTAHFVGIVFSGLGYAQQEKNDGLLYQKTIQVLRAAAKKNKLYSLGFATDDQVTSLSYALLLSRKIGPTPDCQTFSTNIGDHLQLCKLRLFN